MYDGLRVDGELLGSTMAIALATVAPPCHATPSRRGQAPRRRVGAATACATLALRLGRTGTRAVSTDYRSATPRERQFGMYESRRPRSSDAVELPLSQLHIVAAQRQLPMLLEAVPERDPQEVVAAPWQESMLRMMKRA